MTDYGLRAIADAIKLIARAIVIAAVIRSGFVMTTDTAVRQLESGR